MSNKSVNVNLPEEVWKIIEINFKPVSRESDSEILCNIIRNYIAEHGLYPDIHSLAHGHGIKDYLDIHQAMIMSILELLESKGLATYQEFVNFFSKTHLMSSIFNHKNCYHCLP